MSDKLPSINIPDISKPATVLIEKISSAVGVVYEPTRMKREAKAKAEVAKIEAQGSLELSDIQRRGLERMVKQEARKQENIEAITAGAINNLTEDANPENLDEDWVAHFFSKCENVSDEEMRTVWSKILGGEASKPKSFSKRTIDFVAAMDKVDAEKFEKICSFRWLAGEVDPLIFDFSDAALKEKELNFHDINHLQSIGLITISLLTGYSKVLSGKYGAFNYFDRFLIFENNSDCDVKIPFGKVFFTQIGRELSSVVKVDPDYDFYERAVNKWISPDWSIYTPIKFDKV